MFGDKKNERGASLTGYGLVVGLIAVIAIGSITSVGDNVSSLFDTVGDDLDEVVADSGAGSSGGSGSSSSGAPPAPTPAALSMTVTSGDKDNMDVVGET